MAKKMSDKTAREKSQFVIYECDECFNNLPHKVQEEQRKVFPCEVTVYFPGELELAPCSGQPDGCPFYSNSIDAKWKRIK